MKRVALHLATLAVLAAVALFVYGVDSGGRPVSADDFVLRKCPTPTPGTPTVTNTPGGPTKTFTVTSTPCVVKATPTPFAGTATPCPTTGCVVDCPTALPTAPTNTPDFPPCLLTFTVTPTFTPTPPPPVGGLQAGPRLSPLPSDTQSLSVSWLVGAGFVLAFALMGSAWYAHRRWGTH